MGFDAAYHGAKNESVLARRGCAHMVAWRGAPCHPPDWGESHPPPARGSASTNEGWQARLPTIGWLKTMGD